LSIFVVEEIWARDQTVAKIGKMNIEYPQVNIATITDIVNRNSELLQKGNVSDYLENSLSYLLKHEYHS